MSIAENIARVRANIAAAAKEAGHEAIVSANDLYDGKVVE